MGQIQRWRIQVSWSHWENVKERGGREPVALCVCVCVCVCVRARTRARAYVFIVPNPLAHRGPAMQTDLSIFWWEK